MMLENSMVLHEDLPTQPELSHKLDIASFRLQFLEKLSIVIDEWAAEAKQVEADISPLQMTAKNLLTYAQLQFEGAYARFTNGELRHG